MLYRALLICSHEECTDVFEAYGTLEELQTLACDCGCGLEIVGCPDEVDERDAALELIPL